MLSFFVWLLFFLSIVGITNQKNLVPNASGKESFNKILDDDPTSQNLFTSFLVLKNKAKEQTKQIVAKQSQCCLHTHVLLPVRRNEL